MRGVNVMNKMTSSSGAAKRFKKNANGYKHRQSFTIPILTKMSTTRKRHLRGTLQISAADKPLVKRMLPYI